MKAEESKTSGGGGQDVKGEGSGGIQLPAVTGAGTQQARQSAKGKGGVGLKDKQSNSLKDISGTINVYLVMGYIYKLLNAKIFNFSIRTVLKIFTF